MIQFSGRFAPTALPFLYAPVKKTRTMWRNTTATIRWAAIRCIPRNNQPNDTTYSMSFTELYARSTDGTYRNINTNPVIVRIRNSMKAIVPK